MGFNYLKARTISRRQFTFTTNFSNQFLSLISQFRENVSSFNFLANTLYRKTNFLAGHTWCLYTKNAVS